MHYNGLKDIAKYLGFSWTEPSSSGLQSIVWRHQWEESGHLSAREKLIKYNADDCEALRLVTQIISGLGERVLCTDKKQTSGVDVIQADSILDSKTYKFNRFKSTIENFEKINVAAYWDYQRDHISVRKGKAKSKPHLKAGSAKKAITDIEQVIFWEVSMQCPKCSSKDRIKGPLLPRKVKEIVFGRDSIKRRNVKYMFQTYICRNCGHEYGLDERYQHAGRQYGWNLLSYFIYNVVKLHIPQLTVQHSLNRLLGVDVERSTLHILKIRASDYYSVSKQSILNRIIRGNLIHADETMANIQGKLAYVWVLTNHHEVVYILTENREGEFIHKLLADFKGVLVSDFYSAYDSIKCPQQKCLIHLMRDLNEEILNNPFNEDLKTIVAGFSELLNSIVETIDRRGLKNIF